MLDEIWEPAIPSVFNQTKKRKRKTLKEINRFERERKRVCANFVL